MFFLAQHLTINLLSVISAEAFNEASHFMGTNPLVQFLLQPVLIFAVVFHFVMGFVLELKTETLELLIMPIKILQLVLLDVTKYDH